jgi:hypothetical protein
MGIRFVERHHQYQLGKTDDFVRRFVARAMDCPEDAARAAAQVLGGSTGIEPRSPVPAMGAPMGMPMGQPVSGPRKWLRSATSIFSTRGGSRMTPLPVKPPPSPRAKGGAKRLDAPMPLSEFAQRGKSSHSHTHTHTGHGRRDQLTAGERTRILRMLRDEGGRMADEDSQVFVGAPPAIDRDFDDSDLAPAPSPSQQMSAQRAMEATAKPAVVVGLAQANSRRKRQTGGPSPSGRPQPPSQPPPMRPQPPSQPPPFARSKPPSLPPPGPRDPGARTPRRELPKPFEDKTRQVSDQELLAAVRNAPGPGGPDGSLTGAPSRPRPGMFDAPTRVADLDARLFGDDEGMTKPAEGMTRLDEDPRFMPSRTEPSIAPEHLDDEDEKTNMASVEKLAALERAGRASQPARHEERTRAVDIRTDKLSKIDWDID